MARLLRSVIPLTALLAACASSSKAQRPEATVRPVSTHGARPIPQDHSAGKGNAAPQSHGSSHSSDSTSACLGLLCDVGVCFAESAGTAAEIAATEEAEREASVPPPSAPAQPLEVAPAGAPPPREPFFPPELAPAIDQASTELHGGNYAAFLTRYLTREDREALARTPERDLVRELGNGRADVLLGQLAACAASGVVPDGGDRATCVTGPDPLHWRLEPQGWAIEGLAAPPPVPQAPAAAPATPADVPAAQ